MPVNARRDSEGTSTQSTHRFTLELSKDYQAAISDLQHKTGARTQKDIFENALLMLTWAVREVARGRVIGSLDEKAKQYAELQMPILAHVHHQEPPSDRGPGRKSSRRQTPKEAVDQKVMAKAG